MSLGTFSIHILTTLLTECCIVIYSGKKISIIQMSQEKIKNTIFGKVNNMVGKWSDA